MFSEKVKNALIIAGIVGTIFNTINSYDVILESNSNFTFRNTLRIVLTYITPFYVSLYSSSLASKPFEKQILKNTVTEK